MPLSPGDRLDEFLLCRRIGEGAFGEVWEAEDSTSPGKRVAVKVPTHPDSATELRKEGKIQEVLTHRSIVPTLVLRLDHDPPFVVFALVDGPSLADVLRERGTLPWPEAVRVTRGVLYAVGVVLHEMLTGDATRLRFPILSAPKWLSAIAEKVTRPKPEQRFGTAVQMRIALDAPLDAARMRGFWNQLRLPGVRPLWRRAVALLALIALGAGIAWVWFGDHSSQDEPDPTRTPLEVARARVAPHSTTHEEFAGRRQVLPRSRLVASKGAQLALAASHDGAVTASGGMDGTVALWEVSSTRRLREMKAPCATHSLAFSRDGVRLLAGCADGRIRVWEVATAKELDEIRAHVGPVGSLALSEDGSVLVSGGWDGTVHAWDAERGTHRKLLLRGHEGVGRDPLEPKQPDRACQVAIAGGAIMASDETGRLHAWDAGDLREVETMDGDAQGVGAIALSPDGFRVAIAGRGGTVDLLERPPGRGSRTVWTSAAKLRGLAFSARGRYLATCGWGQGVRVCEVGDAGEGAQIRLAGGEANAVLFVGDQVWSANADGTVTTWDLPIGK